MKSCFSAVGKIPYGLVYMETARNNSMGSGTGANFRGWRARAGGLGVLLLAALLCGAAAPRATAATGAAPDTTPTLRIETGMHNATIKRIGGDTQCRLLATSSDDKTVRLWSMPDGKLLRTQRLPIGPGNEGKIFAVAASPDGQLVAAGGWDAAYDSKGNHGIYLFDSATGTSMRRIGAFSEGVINHLAFSPDGTRVEAALHAGGGIRVVDVASDRELMADNDFGGQVSYGLAYGPDGSLFAVGYDGQLRRYGPDLKRSARVKTPGGKQPHAVAVDPSGQRVAVGFFDTPAIEI
jgi:WD40 repeat protein